MQKKSKMTLDKLALMIGKGFKGVDGKFKGVDEKFNKVYRKIKETKEELNDKIDGTEERLDDKIYGLGQKIDAVKKDTEEIRQDEYKVEARLVNVEIEQRKQQKEIKLLK